MDAPDYWQMQQLLHISHQEQNHYAFYLSYRYHQNINVPEPVIENRILNAVLPKGYFQKGYFLREYWKQDSERYRTKINP